MNRNTVRIIRALLLSTALFWQGILLAAHDAWQHVDLVDHPECEVCNLLAGSGKASASTAAASLAPAPNTKPTPVQIVFAVRAEFMGASPRAPPA